MRALDKIRPGNQSLGPGLIMVGVARIELATPAMSTKCLIRKPAEMRRFLPMMFGTSGEHPRFESGRYRTFTAPTFSPHRKDNSDVD